MNDEPEQRIPPQTPAEGVPLVYMNWLRTIGTPGDLSLDIGYQAGAMPPHPVVRLAMTWEHARILRDTLTQALEGVEAVVGEIRDLKPHMTIGPPQFGDTAAPADKQD